MLLLKLLLLAAGFGLFAAAASVIAYDTYLILRSRWPATAKPAAGATEELPAPPRAPVLHPTVFHWRRAGKLAAIAWLPLLAGLSIVVVPDGNAGVRISQISGVRPGTLYPGVHFVVPLIQRVAVYDIRDHIFATSADGDTAAKPATEKPPRLEIQAREGLSLGLGLAVRYRLDPNRLDYIQANLPQPIEQEIVAPVVATLFRDAASNYIVREVFTTRREEFRKRAAEAITARLAADGIVVKEVMLREIQLPAEYAKGLEGLLLKEQESEQLNFETDIKQKQVKIAELEAEAQKAREIKRAEGDARVRVLQAKAEADSMQYTLPLKQKQIEQTRLEAEARKEATIKNAEAAAQSKIIDSKAELERRKLLAAAEANRIRVTSAADAERLQMEAATLKQNPLLIQKIIAERLSDKLQIIMVPTDGKNFFASDVLRSTFSGGVLAPNRNPDTVPPVQNRLARRQE